MGFSEKSEGIKLTNQEKEALEQLFEVKLDDMSPDVSKLLQKSFSKKIQYEEQERSFFLDSLSLQPSDVTDEEYEALKKAYVGSEDKETSGASAFFYVIAVIVWLCGAIIGFVAASDAKSGASLIAFIMSFLPYFLYGCLSFCASELFKRLAKIQSILRSIKGKLEKAE